MDKTKLYSIKLGFIIALAGTLLMLLLLAINFVGPSAVLNDNFMIGGTILFISLYVFLFFGIYKAISFAKSSNDGDITFKKAFIQGILTSMSTAIFAVIFTVIFYELMYPDYVESMQKVLTEKMSDQNLNAAEMELKINEQTKYYSTGMQAQFSFVGNLITGLAFTLILSLFLKSKK